MNILLRELKANLKSLLIWSFVVFLFVSMGMTKFTAYEGNPEMLKILDAMPPALLASFQMNTFNLTTLTGFYGVMFTFFGLVLSIAAVMWGSNFISKEERDKTVEFSLTLPVTRSKIITAKTLAALINCIILILVTWGIILVNVQKYQPDSEFYNFLNLSLVAIFLMQMIFLSLGIFLGCAMKEHKRSSSTAVSLLLGTYFLSTIVGLNEKLDFLKYLTPFKYFDAGIMLHESKLEMPYIWLSLGIIAAALIGGYITYSKRDLYI